MKTALEFYSALLQTEDMPYADRWPLTLELLPDSLLLHAHRSRKLPPEEMMNIFGPMAVTLVHDYFGDEEADPHLATLAIYSLLMSFAAELERRHKHFTKSVTHMDSPFPYDPSKTVQYDPIDPETFTLETVFNYYDTHDE